YVAKLSQLSEQRVAVDPQFKYLNKRTAIAKVTSDQKQVVLDIDKRRVELLSLEKQTLDAENERRIATGQKPFPNWESYQASLDALAESRAKMKANQRPALPEEETFVNEAANVLMDYAKLQNR
ncbi:carboxy terminal-processing peptidase, partial [Acinetobacter baumannii]